MAKIQGKSTSLEVKVAGTFYAIVQLPDISQSGFEAENFESSSLDSATVAKDYDLTGWVEGGEVSFSGWYDPGDTYHQQIHSMITTPEKFEWRITFADAGPTVFAFTSAGGSFETTVAIGEAVKFSATLKIDGLPTFTTG